MPTEHTPTTEDVRWDFGSYMDWRRPERDAEFDRWLTAHDAEVREQVAQEIKAVDSLLASQGWDDPYTRTWRDGLVEAAKIARGDN